MAASASPGIAAPTSFSTSFAIGVLGREASSMPRMPPIDVPTQWILRGLPPAVTRAISAVRSAQYWG